MKAYEDLTARVIEHYRQQARYGEVDGEQSVARVTMEIQALVERLRG
jgi:adenylate kinase family enzyme